MASFSKGGNAANAIVSPSKWPSKSFLPRLQTFMLFILIIKCDPTFALCPSQCSCFPHGTGQTISCGPGLTSFPSPAPGDTLVFIVSALPGQTQNSIPSLSQKDFASFPASVKRIKVSSSNVKQIAANTFSTLSNLQALDLKDNKIASLNRAVFAGLGGKLELLDLTDNSGCRIQQDAFDDLQSLQTLRLAGIGLTMVDDLLSKLASLKTCDLHRNRLVRLDSGSFAHLSNLRHLDVSFNQLREIQPGMKSVLSGLSSLKLDYNPWRCNCALTWAKTLPAKFVHPSHGSGQGIVCDQPAVSEYRDLRNVKDADMTCQPARIDSCSVNRVTVLEGNPISVTCKVSGDPFPDVVWTRPDSTQYLHNLQANVTSIAVMVVPVAEILIHNGKWKIEVYNVNGSDSKILEIDVITTSTVTTTTTTTTTTTRTTTAKSTISTSAVAGGKGSATAPLFPPGSPGHLASTKKSSPHVTPDINQSPSSPSPDQKASSPLPSSINVIVIVAATAGGVVCITGIALFSAVIYKTKQKIKVSSRRKSVYSMSEEIQMFARQAGRINGTFRVVN